MGHKHASTENCNYNCSVLPTFDQVYHDSNTSEVVAEEGSFVTLSGT